MKERKDIPERYKWDLSVIVKDEDEWERLFSALSVEVGKLVEAKGKLADDGVLLKYLTLKTELSQILGRLYVWAKMRKDEDTRNQEAQGRTDRIETLAVKISAALSFERPELCAFSDKKLTELNESPAFADYSVFFKEILRSKKITLSEKEEKIIAEVGAFADNSQTVFSMFDNADIRFKPVKDEKGNVVELSHGVYSLLMQSPLQEVRENAFNSMFSTYKSHINTLAAVYAGNVKKDWFYAKLRGFDSSLEYSMYQENVAPTAYRKLINSLDGGLKSLHKYVALRKDILGLKSFNMYDLYVPLVQGKSLSYPYEKSYALVKDALLPLGERYGELLDEAFSNGWIDVCETKGKRSGAYSWGTYGSHPFVLLNYQKTTHDVFTIAHELGHAMHSYFSNETQCYEKAGYEIFVAEIASTVNEVLLLKYLIGLSHGAEKKYLLSYYLDMFRTTVFRQTMFAEFEVAAHAMVEKDEPLTSKTLGDAYYELNKKYYGKAVAHNDLIRYEWARIPHFYNSFYVYKYATGMISAVSIATRILEEGETAVKDYMKFLSAGGSLPPLDILRLAGVDMETDEPFNRAMTEFSSCVKMLNDLFKNK